MNSRLEALRPGGDYRHQINSEKDLYRLTFSRQETAATPMPRMGVGLAKAGSMAKSLSTSSKPSSPTLGGSIPKLGSAGSSFAETLIMQVAGGRDPQDVLRGVFEASEHDIERQSSVTSPAGSPVGVDIIKPGMHVGIRGPVHNGFHTIDSVEGGIVTMKCGSGKMVSIPLSDLSDHEVVHALENV